MSRPPLERIKASYPRFSGDLSVAAVVARPILNLEKAGGCIGDSPA